MSSNCSSSSKDFLLNIDSCSLLFTKTKLSSGIQKMRFDSTLDRSEVRRSSPNHLTSSVLWMKTSVGLLMVVLLLNRRYPKDVADLAQ